MYLEWFKFFLDNIPSARPVLLIQDGHASHLSIELIELARANEVCLPAHTTHVLQPLDVKVSSHFVQKLVLPTSQNIQVVLLQMI